ncbi:hypothetical protein J3R82DRAFT_2946 [Butyriboletus roseoflavus]|nr:hypothetical protein J3R82DRAFT_2946 [Butyriboletus roseoflavus]
MSATLNKAHVRVDTAYQQLQHAKALVGHIQSLLNIQECWEIGGDKYNQWKEEAMITKYHAALDELERLVMMCYLNLRNSACQALAISFVSKSPKPFSDILRQFEVQSATTIRKHQHSILLTQI